MNANASGFMSAFGNPGTGPGGSGGGGGSSVFGAGGNAFGSNNTGASAFGGSTGGSVFNGGNSNANSAFGSSSSSSGGFGGGSGATGFNNSYSNSKGTPALNNNHGANFGTSGNVTSNTGLQRGGGVGGGAGRGRGNPNYRGGRGGGGNRGSANMTYVAPGLSTGNHHQNQNQYQHLQQQQQQLQQHGQQQHASSGGSSGFSPADAGSANRGRGGYAGRGRSSGPGGGVTGQYRSLQWRPETGTQSQHTGQSAQTNYPHDCSMDAATAFPTASAAAPSSTQNGGFNSGFNSGAHQGSAFGTTVFGGQSNYNQGADFGNRSGSGSGSASAFGAQSAQHPTQSVFGGGSFGSMSSAPASASQVPAAGAGGAHAVGNSSISTKPEDVFAVPNSRHVAPNSDSLRSTDASAGLITPHKQQTAAESPLSRLQDSNTPEDADSRLARFSAVPIGNRYDELKEARVKEREDAIRKGAIPDPNKRGLLKDAITFVGTCRDMCPEFERHEREYQSDVKKFEKFPDSEHIDHYKAVKAYARPAAGVEQPLPSDVRPPDVLLSTLDYLMTEIVAKTDLSDSHAFIRDRTRSIRQDFTLQNSRGIEAVHAHEIIARYHILCIHQLCESKSFSEQQEMEQLRKVLTSLQEFYDDMRTEKIPCPNEAEFRAYHILSHLRDPDMIRQAQLLPINIFMDPYIQTAAELHALTRRNNDLRRRAKIQSEASPNFFSRFFKMIEGSSVTYLTACLLETNFGEIRKGALKALNKSYLDQHEGFLVQDLVGILGFDDEQECMDNCEEYGLALTHYGQPAVVFGRKDQVTRRRIFKEGTVIIKQHRNERIVEAKRSNYSTIQIIYGEIPGPRQKFGAGGGARPIVPPTIKRQSVTGQAHGAISANTASRFGPAVAAAAGAGALAATALKPAVAAVDPKVANVFDFGLNRSSRPPAASAAAASGPTRTSTLQPLASSGSVFTHPTLPKSVPAATSAPIGQILTGMSLPTNGLATATPSLSRTMPAPVFGSSGLPNFASTPSQPGNTYASSTTITTSTGLSSASTQPSFTFLPPGSAASTNPFTFGGPTQAPAAPWASTTPPSSQPTTSKFNAPSTFSVLPPISSSSTGQPFSPPSTLPPPAAVLPKSDATKIVTSRGKTYPRSLVDSIMKEFLERETDRIIRMTAAQMSQEVVVERSLRRAENRRVAIHQHSAWIITEVVDQVTSEITEEILADLYRESKLQQRVITQWKEYTRKCRQRADELRRRQEHFLANVRAMGSRAGLVDGNPMAARIKEYTSKQQRIRSGSSSAAQRIDGQTMAQLVTNKRKRLLSIGQEGSPDMALVAGLKRVAEPRREMWAPLPVLKIVESRYRQSSKRTQQQLHQEEEAVARSMGPALTKRRWRLFVNTPNFKDMNSKWLLTKLGVDMGRQTKVQQRSGTMIAVHQSRTSDENAMDLVVCGIEDQSVKDLLGMSKYVIMETAAFMFEFSRIPFTGSEATDDVIREYWVREHERLVKFLACFPKVKQPIVFILWTDVREMWERISPRMIEYLELDKMVGSPQGPLLGYNFLNLTISGMSLDPYIVGSLEWLASETRDFFEEPSVLLRGLLDKYRPIYDWALCRITLAEGPLYSQFDEEDEEETHRWLVKTQESRKRFVNGGTALLSERQPPRNLFVEATESGFNLAVDLFNLELESIAQTIEAKGQEVTREGAQQEGKVKDAMARFIRQAELPQMKRGAIQERINFGMDPKSAFCDFVDVYIATLGGLAKEQQNLVAKTTMRTEIWEMLRSSKEDRVLMEAIFKRISSQILSWVETGILDTTRFSVRMDKLEQQRHDLRWQQKQFKGQQDEKTEETDQAGSASADVSFKPILIHDEVDIEGNVFDFEITVQSEVHTWEKQVEAQARHREERALLVPTEDSSRLSRAGWAAPNALGAARFGDGRKRRAPERPMDAMKKSRIDVRATADEIEGHGDDNNLFLTSQSAASSPRSSVAPSSQSPTAPTIAPSGSTTGASTPPHPLHEWLLASKSQSNDSRLSSGDSARPNFKDGEATTLFSFGGSGLPVEAASPTDATGSSTTRAGDRLARLRSLIQDVKTNTLHQR